MCFCNILEGWNKLTEEQRIAIKKQADAHQSETVYPVRIDTETNMEVMEKVCGKLVDFDPDPFAWPDDVIVNKEN